MSQQLLSTLAKVLAPVLAITLVLAITRLRRISWRDDLRLVWPRFSVTLFWSLLWVIWLAAGEWAIHVFGMAQPQPWTGYSPAIIALRVLAIGLLGPIAEELVVRGVLFFRVSGTRLGPWGAVIVCAAIWALVHIQYDWRTITMIFLDGLFLGTARYRSRSTFVPMLLHITANLLSITQSLVLAA